MEPSSNRTNFTESLPNANVRVYRSLFVTEEIQRETYITFYNWIYIQNTIDPKAIISKCYDSLWNGMNLNIADPTAFKIFHPNVGCIKRLMRESDSNLSLFQYSSRNC